jgi:AcrR family transcriptional regulator
MRVGNREDLLAAARRCLDEKGYAHTTARDIAAAAGTSLAAIGYHYRSTEALLNAALFKAIEEIGDELARALSAEDQPPPGSLERFEAYWTQVVDSFANHRQIWAGTLEIFGQADRVPEVRQAIADGLEDGRRFWPLLLLGESAFAGEAEARAAGSFYQALLSGVLVQWLIDPERAPSGRDLAEGLRIIAERLRR